MEDINKVKNKKKDDKKIIASGGFYSSGKLSSITRKDKRTESFDEL